MMKRIKHLYFVLAVLLAFTACTDDILDKKPLDVITDLDVWKSEPLVRTYINGIYNKLDYTYVDQNNMDNYPWQITEALYMDDTGGPGFGGVPKFGSFTKESSWLNWWGYSQIRQMNYGLEMLPTATISDAAKKSSIAEIRFLRAMSYFHMVKLFGGVPLILKVQGVNDPAEELYVPRAKEVDVYNFVISELDAIAADLPESVPASELGRPTKAAGLALKARAALYAGSIAQNGSVQLNGVVGIPAGQATSFFQKSYDASKAIMGISAATGKPALYKSNPDLVKNFQDIFFKSNNVEVIMAHNMWAAAGFEGTGFPNIWNLTEAPGSVHPWGAGNATNCYLEFVNEFENADGSPGKLAINENTWTTTQELFGKKEPRFFASVYTENTPFETQEGTTFTPVRIRMYSKVKTLEGTILTSGTYKDIPVAPTGQGKAFGCLKMTKGNQWPSAVDWILFRYAEVLLNHAESAFELGKTGEALAAVNLVRERVKLPPLASITREAIRHERRIELAFESLRFWDLRRWRTAESKLNGSIYTTLELTLDYASYAADPLKAKYLFKVIPADGGQVMVFGAKNYYHPITPARISNNKALVENPGY